MPKPGLTSLQRRLLQVVQCDFPLVSRPFQQLAEQTGASEEEVLTALRELLQRGVIRELAPIFDADGLGYHSTLAALCAPEPELERAVALINAYPEVTHNYLRAHRYNVWFTVTAPSQAAVARIIAEIQARAGCGPVLSLPTQRRFKIQVVFDFAEEAR